MNDQKHLKEDPPAGAGICRKCKKKLPKEAKWCPECGGPVSPQPIPWFVWLLIAGLILSLIGKLMKAGVI